MDSTHFVDFRTDTTEIAACLFIMGACLGKCLGKDVGDRGQPLGGGGGGYRPTGGGEDAPDRDAVRQNALAAAEVPIPVSICTCTTMSGTYAVCCAPSVERRRMRSVVCKGTNQRCPRPSLRRQREVAMRSTTAMLRPGISVQCIVHSFMIPRLAAGARIGVTAVFDGRSP